MNSSSKVNPAYRFDDIVVDCDGLCLEKGGQQRKITPRAFDVLVYLVEHPGRIIEKQELFDEVWKEKFVTDNALTRIIKEIRQVIGDDADAPQYIETVPKRGYRFIAEVKRDEETAQASRLAGGSVSQKDSPPQVEPLSVAERKEQTLAARRDGARAGLSLSGSTLLIGGAIAVGAIAIVLFFILRTQTPRGPAEISGVLRTAKITYSSGLDLYPSISPDGNSVAYSSDQSGSFEIYVKQLGPGGREIQLTSDSKQNLEPTWSPDGRLIAYYSRDRGGIWIMPALGGVARQITEFGSRPAWSRDGFMIAFQSEPLSDLLGSHIGPSTIWIVSPQEGNARPITEVGNPTGGHGVPSWSPDGKRIVFVSREISEAILWTVSIEGADLKQITRSRSIYDPTYSPDGQYIYYPAVTSGSGFGLWKARISPATSDPIGEPVLVVDPGSALFAFPTISADGKRLACALLSSTSNLWSVPLSPTSGEATGPQVPITNDTSPRNSNPAFSPDGRKIAFNSIRTGTSDMWLVDADGKNPVQLTTTARNALPSWFPGNDRIAFTSDRSGHSALWATTPTGGRETFVLDVGQDMDYPRLSPDGKQIAFQSRKSGAVNIWTATLEDGQPKQLTFDKELMGWPCWSPDGKLLAFEMRRGDETHIVLLPSNGGAPKQLTSDRGQSFPHTWSPDGDKIAFAGFRNGYWNVWWVSRTTNEQKQVTSYRKLNAFVRYPAWSPLGNQIVYEYNETTGNIWLMELK